MMKAFLCAGVALFLSSASAMAAGAIAVDDEAGSKASEVGYGTGFGSTAAEAAAEAIKACKESGNSSCKVEVKFGSGKCGAYAASKSHYGTGTGPSEGEATQAALEACGSGCKLVVADCDK